MKHYITASLMMLLIASNSLAQNNVELSPAGGKVCNSMPVSIVISGNSFNPVSYLWSTGETSPVIEIVNSGTYTLTVTGYQGSSSSMVTHTLSAAYDVLPAPKITAYTNLWVCKGDTVRLGADTGYDQITWSNGATGTSFSRVMNTPPTPGFPKLDTVSVSYTATVNGVCSSSSQKVVLRAIRKPHGVGKFYQNKMNIMPTDSIPAGLIMEYIYPVTYHMKFTDLSNPSNVINYITAPGSRRAPASMLSAGSSYAVETTPEINGIMFCTGAPSIIGIASGQVFSSGDRIGSLFSYQEEVCTYQVYDTGGRLLMEKKGEQFKQEWLNVLTPQMLIIHRIGEITEVIKVMKN